MNVTNYKKSLLAGILIGIGTIICSLIPNIFIGSIYFSFGLLTIIHLKFNLFTGKIGFATNKQYKFLDYLIMILINWFGCIMTVGLYVLSDYTKLSIYFTGKAVDKYSRPILTMFIMGIFCGALIHIAVSANNYLITIFAVSIFILIGAEHCIVDIAFWIFEPSFDSTIKLLAVVLGNSFGALFIEDLLKLEKYDII